MKGEEVSQQAVRADMLEKRLENARRDGDGKLENLKQELAEAKKTIVDKDRQVGLRGLLAEWVYSYRVIPQ